ncbi:MAG TPA: hypothetical protein P5136_01670 [Methanofastidiosum sp.]|nr:hypothetical protein [Methanofastidiosum sp.]
MTTRRYSHELVNLHGGSDLQENPKGEWIKYEDYEKLEKQLEEAEKIISVGMQGYSAGIVQSMCFQYINQKNKEILKEDRENEQRR